MRRRALLSRKKPLGGELGGFSSADIATAIAIEGADFLARVLRRFETRGARNESAQVETKSPEQVRRGDDFKIEIPWRKGGTRIFRRIAFVSKRSYNGQYRDFGRWESLCVKCGKSFQIDIFPSITSPEKSKQFEITTCQEHRRTNNIKSPVAPIYVNDDLG